MLFFPKMRQRFATLACLWPALVFAQLADPDGLPAAASANPEASVPAVRYQSVFAGLPAGVVQDSVSWADANAAVGQFPRGHADIVKWETRQAAGLAAPPGGGITPKSIANHDHSTMGKP